MIKVEPKEGENIERAIRRWKKLCDREGLIRDIRRSAYYEKPSDRRRRDADRRRKNAQRANEER